MSIQVPDHQKKTPLKTVRKVSGSCPRETLAQTFDEILQPARFRDYCPNGLQVEGKARIRTLVSGVTASLELIDRAIAVKADAIVVHHGYFFRGEDERVIGQKKLRLARLLAAKVNLFAFHLPLDAHATLGNNAQLGKQLGWPVTGVFGDSSRGAALIAYTDLPQVQSVEKIAKHVARVLKRQPLVVGALGRPVRRVAWCTGAAQDMLQEAINRGADLFISGEISERTTHLARELGVAYLAAGHHATERFGAEALGQLVAEKLSLTHQFIDVDNPV